MLDPGWSSKQDRRLRKSALVSQTEGSGTSKKEITEKEDERDCGHASCGAKKSGADGRIPILVGNKAERQAGTEDTEIYRSGRKPFGFPIGTNLGQTIMSQSMLRGRLYPYPRSYIKSILNGV